MLLHDDGSHRDYDEDAERPGCGFIALIGILAALALFTYLLVALF